MVLSEKIVAYVVSFIVIAIAFIFFILNISTFSVHKKQKTISTELITENVQISRNQYGIPFISAKNDRDLYFGIGYAQAQDRLWQMDVFRRMAQGRLSEIFGNETIIFDKFIRAFQIEKISSIVLDSLRMHYPEEYQALLAYSEGINTFIHNNAHKLSFEFYALDYMPTEWMPLHSLMIAKLVGFDLSLSIWLDIALAEIAAKIGFEKAMDLIPSGNNDIPFMINEYNNNSTALLNNNKNTSNDISPILQNSFLEAKEYQNILQKTIYAHDTSKSFLDILPYNLSSGSNNWVIKKTNGQNSPLILANDPHLIVGLPARWYQMQIHSPNIHSIGLAIPGLPIIVIGRNEKISWGITNMMADVTDFFIERLDESKSNYFIDEENTEPLDFKTDTIKILNQPDEIYYIRTAGKNVIISDYHPFRDDSLLIDFHGDLNDEFYESNVLSFKWVGNIYSNEFVAGYRINKASNWNEFIDCMKNWGLPTLNFAYADIDGNMGILPVGKIPKRAKLCNPNLPNPSWLQDYSWDGFYNTDDFPSLYNPSNRFVYSANNKLSNDVSFFISNYYEPDSRAKRIVELLNQSDEYTVRDAQLMQNDVLSPYAKEICEIIEPILEEYVELFNTKQKEAYNLFIDWDYILSANSPQAIIYYMFIERLIYNTFYDKLGNRLYKTYLYVPSLSQRKIKELIKQSDSEWFDNTKTSDVENKEYIIFTSFSDAINILDSLYDGKNIKQWKYGDFHKLDLKHIFSENPLLKSTVTISDLKKSGDNTTINVAQTKLYEPFEVFVAASSRFIADMSENYIYTSLPGGSSGDPVHPNYSDQVQLWLNGGYIRLSFTEKPDAEYELMTIIKPKK